ncbi:siderophore ABC transporter substrate-binding protein [Pontibacillus litoralis]|uniref:Iron ABC transporter substrate-binding protein n=1 Tax=Pontibacillus litoralis JSM 072002 TaxID=1385512 RepID=A0A0A5G524_9BACI|nr:siderophore ABC transporter substrate-binding protein [Pontibacillus litoralis]KGX86185.1 iron ABC transporter substrate-binding protein [Pontibacillus litoralis JSM 072002]
MKNKLMLMFIISLLTLALAACGSSNEEGSSEDKSNASDSEKTQEEATEEITVKHELGETTVKKNPENVVVFDYGALDTLDQLGVDVAGVAQSSNIPDYLSEYKDEEKYENAGGLKEPDFEKIHSMEPEIILISGRQGSHYEKLSEIAPTIYVGVDSENYIESFKKNVTVLGEIFGKEKEAKQELETIQTSIDELNKTTSESDEKGLVILSTGGKVTAYGPGSRFGMIHDEFGVKAARDDIEKAGHGMSISFEFISETDPDYLFVIDRDAAIDGETVASEVLNNDLVNGTKAAKNDNIVYLDPAVWYLSGGGLQSVSMMVEELQQGIQ